MFILEFPQNLIGFLLSILFSHCDKFNYKGITVFHIKGNWGAFSLFRYVFADDSCFINSEIIKHEYGHSLQSRKLLFLFIFIIAIPSLIHAYLHKKGNYYSFYTEQWASKLGNSSLR